VRRRLTAAGIVLDDRPDRTVWSHPWGVEIMNAIARLAFVVLLSAVAQAFADPFVMPPGMSESDRARFGRFETFQIRGVCGSHDFERLATLGVNTVRGYTIPDPPKMRKQLDNAHQAGLKVIVSEWMPHHGDNEDHRGGTWKFDYDARADTMVSAFTRKVEAIGDHPAILMWGLGNEVRLDEPYLRVVNRMSLAIHERFPDHVTSLTMVNAKPEAIEAVKRFAPDIDVLGIQSYSPGAVRNSIKQAEKHWARPYYLSEFNGKGPWNFEKTPWGVALDEPVTSKVKDVRECYDAIDAAPSCLGSTIFTWGWFDVNRPTYFSLLLDPDPNGPGDHTSVARFLMTPQAEVMAERFRGRPLTGNRAPVLSQLGFPKGARWTTVTRGETLHVAFSADDPDGDAVTFVGWILESASRSPRRVAGPYQQESANHAAIPAPEKPGEYLLMVYAIDGKGGGSASTLPFKVADKP
jgi:hypothetical protein